MNKQVLRVLLVEDDEDGFLLTRGLLGEITTFDCQTEWVSSLDAAQRAIAEKVFDVCLVDYHLGAHTGLEFLRQAAAQNFRQPMIMLTGQDDRQVDLEAMSAGAADYLVKSKMEAHLLERSIRYALERKRAEDRLAEAAKRERAMIENALDIICTLDTEGRFVTINPACFKMWGYRPEELVGRKYIELVAPEDVKKTIDVVQSILSGAEVTNFENCYQHKNGTLVNLAWTSHWSDSEQLMFAVAHDITERKRIEQALRENEATFRNLFDNAPVAYHELDTEGRFTRINHTEELLLGYTSEELKGRYPWEIIVESDSRQSVKEKLSGRQQLLPIERTFIRKDGSLISVLNEDRAILDANGKISGIRSTLQNITELKRAEKVLHESELRYRQLFESNPNPTWICEVETLKFLAVNQAATRLFGYSVEEFQQLTTKDLRPPEDLPFFTDYIEQVKAGVENFNSIRLQKKDNTIIEAEITLQAINFAGKRARLTLITDVTERKRQEKELHASQQLLKLVIDTLPQAVWWKDSAGVFLGANRFIAELSGFDSPEEMIGLTDYDMPWTKEEADFYRECDCRVQTSGIAELNIIESQLQIDGRQALISTNKVPLRSLAGEIVGVLGTFADITEQRRAEIALQNSRDYLDRIINEVADPIFVINRRHELTLINDALCKLMNRTREETIGKTVLDFLDAKQAAISWDQDEQVFATKTESRTEEHILNPNGETRVTIHKKNYYIDKNGEEYIVGVILDITESKLLEAKLREQAEHLSAVVQTQSDIATSELDLEKVMNLIAERTHKLTNADGAVIELLDGDEMVYTAGSGVAAPHLGLRLKAASTLSGVCVRTGETVLCNETETDSRVDQAACRVVGVRSMLMVPLRKDRKPIGTIKVLSAAPNSFGKRDVYTLQLMAAVMDAAVSHHTEFEVRKEAEAELKCARDEALASARLKSEFLANMSHEIRTPMNGVIGMTGVLLETQLDDEQKDFVETIQTSADALLRIIDDILDFSKIEAGQLHFEMIDFDLNEVVETAIEMLAERAFQKNIELAGIVYQNVPVWLRSDPGRLRQILTNLIGNAVKFTDTGEVTVSVQKESETDSHVGLRFEVRDTGIGIAPEAQKRLFQAFVQADGSTTRKYGGTGLGLAISKQLVELMNGTIGIESKAGEGATFWFTAKFEKQSSPNLPVHSATEASLEDLSVLIVDDNQTNRRIFVHQTASWGMLPTTAESGADALAQLGAAAARGKPFDLAILDLMMPEMDGFELARRIKTDPQIANTHLVLLPSYGKRGHGQQARHGEFAAYLQKPVRQSQLYNCLTTIISQAAERGDNQKNDNLITQHTLGQTQRHKQKFGNSWAKARILVAEDNHVNQKVTLKQLQSLGYAADVVPDGRAAVEAIKNHHYELVLMDCQMPIADGFEATHEIRHGDMKSRRPVIVAMTAHALEGEREKCLQAGMDDYVSKPVKIETLAQTLKKWLPNQPESKNIVQPPMRGTSFDARELRADEDGSVNHELLDSFKDLQQPGEPDIVAELIDLFLEDAEKRITILAQAGALGDLNTVREQAHGLKGSSGNIGASRIHNLSNRLAESPAANSAANSANELAANKANIEKAQQLITDLAAEFEKVRRILTARRALD